MDGGSRKEPSNMNRTTSALLPSGRVWPRGGLQDIEGGLLPRAQEGGGVGLS